MTVTLPDTSQFELLSEDRQTLIEDLLPARCSNKGRSFSDARSMVEAIYRYRCGITWRDAPAAFGAWQTIWTWHHWMAGDCTWDAVLQRLLTEAHGARLIDWSVSVVPRSRGHISTPRTSLVSQEGWGRTARVCLSSRLTTQSAVPTVVGAARCTVSSTGRRPLGRLPGDKGEQGSGRGVPCVARSLV
ncbi:transposase [Amycolatopsis sp. NBRC 101858]|uniref:transposase n=1 Tax=Amycolatopsis sp. NBRC 101858 TaxID=3032200 RepID=UPI0033370AD3